MNNSHDRVRYEYRGWQYVIRLDNAGAVTYAAWRQNVILRGVGNHGAVKDHIDRAIIAQIEQLTLRSAK